jgi:hypothetical protein
MFKKLSQFVKLLAAVQQFKEFNELGINLAQWKCLKLQVKKSWRLMAVPYERKKTIPARSCGPTAASL